MKNIKLIGIIALIAILSVPNSGCKKGGKFFPADINQDPTSTIDAPPFVLLAPAELALAYTQHGDIGRYTGLFTQQHIGAYRQFASFQNYSFNTADFGNVWNTLYTTCMGNLNKIIVSTTATKNANYCGVAQALMAYTTVMCVDLWNDVPYSDAFKGLAQLQPKYDKGAAVYTEALALCDKALVNLAKTGTAAGSILPGGEDLIYGGDVALWISFVHGLKARIYLHQSKNDAGAIAKGLAEAALSMASNADDAAVSFVAASYGNPWVQYQSERADISFLGGNAYTLMIANNDPRIDMLIDTSSDEDGNFKDAPGAALSGNVPLISFVELKFIEAELAARDGDAVAAQAAYDAAVTASFNALGHAGEEVAYLTAHPFPVGTLDLQLAGIISEKYIALFEHPETYSDWRRTGFPALVPNSGSAIPRRFLYPDSEEQFNGSNMPTGVTLYSKVWWDK
jgi:hypothetical protein